MSAYAVNHREGGLGTDLSYHPPKGWELKNGTIIERLGEDESALPSGFAKREEQ